MLAIFEHSGFTRMEEFANPVPPEYYCFAIGPSPTNFSLAPLDVTASVTMQQWTFRLYEVNWVNGVRVAMYRFER